MKFYFTGLQHTHDGQEIPIQTFAYDNLDDAKDKWHKEMSYAHDAVDTLDGLTVIIYDSTGAVQVNDFFMREVDGQQIPIEPVVNTN